MSNDLTLHKEKVKYKKGNEKKYYLNKNMKEVEKSNKLCIQSFELENECNKKSLEYPFKKKFFIDNLIIDYFKLTKKESVLGKIFDFLNFKKEGRNNLTEKIIKRIENLDIKDFLFTDGFGGYTSNKFIILFFRSVDEYNLNKDLIMEKISEKTFATFSLTLCKKEIKSLQTKQTYDFMSQEDKDKYKKDVDNLLAYISFNKNNKIKKEIKKELKGSIQEINEFNQYLKAKGNLINASRKKTNNYIMSDVQRRHKISKSKLFKTFTEKEDLTEFNYLMKNKKIGYTQLLLKALNEKTNNMEIIKVPMFLYYMIEPLFTFNGMENDKKISDEKYISLINFLKEKNIDLSNLNGPFFNMKEEYKKEYNRVINLINRVELKNKLLNLPISNEKKEMKKNKI